MTQNQELGRLQRVKVAPATRGIRTACSQCTETAETSSDVNSHQWLWNFNIKKSRTPLRRKK